MLGKNYLLTFIVLVLGTFSAVAGSAPQFSQEDLDALNEELAKVPQYDKQVYTKLDALKKQLSKSTRPLDRYNIENAIGDTYITFVSDSAYTHYKQAQAIADQLRDSTLIVHSKISVVNALAVSGMFLKAEQTFNELSTWTIPADQKLTFYECAKQLYYYCLDYVYYQGSFADIYKEKLTKYRTLAMDCTDPNDPQWYIYKAELLIDEDRTIEAKKLLDEATKKVFPFSRKHAVIMSKYADIAAMEGNGAMESHYLAMSAICDIRSSVKENLSIQKLAIYLFSIHEIESAYKYLMISMDDANFCGARLRNLQISRNMAVISSAYQEQIDSKNTTLLIIIIVICLLVVILIGGMIFIVVQLKKIHDVKERLRAANNLKEEYMGHFLNLCSYYIDTNKMIVRKINARQFEDLQRMAKRGKLVGDNNKMFYESFDSAFLHIYPTFVDDFNKLLKEDERIIPEEIGHLTMELRIFAFLRMGIDDCSKIASFLDFSINTIYAYRNKVRNKAINRDTFDQDVLMLGRKS